MKPQSSQTGKRQKYEPSWFILSFFWILRRVVILAIVDVLVGFPFGIRGAIVATIASPILYGMWRLFFYRLRHQTLHENASEDDKPLIISKQQSSFQLSCLGVFVVGIIGGVLVFAVFMAWVMKNPLFLLMPIIPVVLIVFLFLMFRKKKPKDKPKRGSFPIFKFLLVLLILGFIVFIVLPNLH